MVRLPLAILRSIDKRHISFREWSALQRFVPLFLAVSFAAGVTTLSGTASMAQVATPGALSETTAMSPVAAASTWLQEQQDSSGGFRGLSGEPDPDTTTDAVI